jgi:transcription elongation factor Elf1
MNIKLKPLNQEDFPMKIIEDLGTKYSSKNSKQKYRYAIFECPLCGKHFESLCTNVKRKHTASCGCYKLPILNQEEFPMKIIKDLGRRYFTEGNTRKTRVAIFECPLCGEHFKSPCKSIKSRDTVSCGCLHKGLTVKYPKIYKRWQGMKERCYNPKSKNYKDYGGRGITVCEQWINSFESYLNFVLELGLTEDSKLHMDRRENDGNYEPNNMKLSTPSENSQNVRKNIRNSSGFRGVSYNKRKNKY